jgi:ATP-dependent DNA ligase
MLEMVWNDGGEGVVLRSPKSLYINGNSDDVVKLKVERERGGERGRECV